LPKGTFGSTIIEPDSAKPQPKEDYVNNVTVILPTYNERDNIGPLIERTLAAIKDWAIEVLVVDDDSPDGTWQIVEEMAGSDPRIKLCRRTEERGLTSAIWHGIQHTSGDVVLWMDCDLSMPPESIPDLLAQFASPTIQIAIGSRYVPGGRDIGHSLTGQLFSRAINLFAGLLLGFHVRDYTSGFVAARRKVFERITLRGDYGEYCIDFLYRAKRLGFRVVEVPYDCVERAAGESKTALNAWGYIRRGVKYVETILRLRLKPGRTE
jgi:dolichol-phosphate mannosyltransferase